MTGILVIPDGAGCWVVEPPERGKPRPVYASASEAEAAARTRARTEGHAKIVIVDRYNRVRETAVPASTRA